MLFMRYTSACTRLHSPCFSQYFIDWLNGVRNKRPDLKHKSFNDSFFIPRRRKKGRIQAAEISKEYMNNIWYHGLQLGAQPQRNDECCIERDIDGSLFFLLLLSSLSLSLSLSLSPSKKIYHRSAFQKIIFLFKHTLPPGDVTLTISVS